MSLQLIELSGPRPAFARISRSAAVFQELSVERPDVQLAIWQPKLSPQAQNYLSSLPGRLLAQDLMVGGQRKVWRGKRPDPHKVVKYLKTILPHGAGRAEVLGKLSTAFGHLARLSPAGFSSAELRLSKRDFMGRSTPARLPHYDPHNAWTLFGGAGIGTTVYDTAGLNFAKLRKKGLLSQRRGVPAKHYGLRPIPKAKVLTDRAYQLPAFSFAIWRAGKIENPLLHDFPAKGLCGGRASVLVAGQLARS